MIDLKAIHDELTKYLAEVAESYFDNRVDYYKPRYVDLQIKFSVDPATNALTDMFTDTGGTFTGTPSINTTYYLSNTNTVVS